MRRPPPHTRSPLEDSVCCTGCAWDQAQGGQACRQARHARVSGTQAQYPGLAIEDHCSWPSRVRRGSVGSPVPLLVEDTKPMQKVTCPCFSNEISNVHPHRRIFQSDSRGQNHDRRLGNYLLGVREQIPEDLHLMDSKNLQQF